MIMYLIESTVPGTEEVRFYGKGAAYIDADQPHRFVSQFAVRYGFLSFYAADRMMKKTPGTSKMVVRADV